MPTITRAQARTNELTLLRLAAGPTRREEGSRRLRHSATDAAVYAALVSHLNWSSGLCCPGYRAIARLAGVALGTVGPAMARLRAAGFVRVQRRPTRVPGHGMRWMHRYELVPAPAAELVAPRSVLGTQPESWKIQDKAEAGLVLWEGSAARPASAERLGEAMRAVGWS